MLKVSFFVLAVLLATELLRLAQECRNPERSEGSQRRIRKAVVGARLEHVEELYINWGIAGSAKAN